MAVSPNGSPVSNNNMETLLQNFTTSGPHTVSVTCTRASQSAYTLTETVTVDLEDFSCFCNTPTGIAINAQSSGTLSETGLIGYANTQQGNTFTYDNRCIALAGNLVVQNGQTLRFTNGELKMQPGAQITVENGGRLELIDMDRDFDPNDGDDRQGIHGCDQLWRGIVLQEGTTANGLDGGRVLIVDSHLGDAIYGIENRHETIIDARNNHFERNWVGIYVPPPAVSGIQSNFSTPISLFGSVGNTFSGTDQLLPKPPGYGALQISSFSRAGYLLNDCRYRVGNFFAGNTLENLQSGIEGRNVSLDVYNNNFRNTVAPWLTNPVTHGIKTSDESDVRVRPGNTFRDLSFGLRSTGDFSIRFQASTIEEARTVGIGIYNPVVRSQVRIWDNPEISVATLPNAVSPPAAIVVTGVDHVDKLRIYDNPDISVTSDFFPAGYPIPTAIQLIGVLAESTTDTPPIIKNNGIGITK